MLHVLGPGQIGHMDQAVDAVLDFKERAEIGEFADAAFDHGTDGVAFANGGPGVRFQLFDAERDAAVADFYFEHHGFHLVAGLHHFAGVLHAAAPGHFGDVDQAFDAGLDLDKRAIIGDAHDAADDAAAGGAARGQSLPRVRRQLTDPERDAFFFAVELQNLDG